MSVRFVTLGEAEVVELEEGRLTSRRLVRKEHGSEKISFNVSTLREGYQDAGVAYLGHDEIVYVLSGRAEVTVDGKSRIVGPGTAIFVPEGERYGYRVLEGPNEVIAVFAPARS